MRSEPEAGDVLPVAIRHTKDAQAVVDASISDQGVPADPEADVVERRAEDLSELAHQAADEERNSERR
jgi:hypothetical protein